MYNDLVQELSTNFIDYAVAVNSDRSIPNAADGLKPVAKRIIYGAYDCGFRADKPHVKNANIVGNVMSDYHPHGDSSIYGALVRLSQNWVMRYPLIDFHGSNGNIAGDGPAHYRYTEGRTSKLVEDGMLRGIKKGNVDYTDNYSETKKEPIELPSIFPNLLCNPNSGIGVALASNWGCANLGEVAQAIFDYLDNKEPILYGDFPTGGVIINKDVYKAIAQTGKGTVKIRGKAHFENNKIIFTEIPYGTNTEGLLSQVGEKCEKEDITGISDIRDESNKKGVRIVIECEKSINPEVVLEQLYSKTDFQTSFSYNQVALVNKTPTELNLKDCIKIYIEHNKKCLLRELEFDINKIKDRLHILEGLIKALDIIDDIIAMIKKSASSTEAKNILQERWGFSLEQSKAILDMRLAKLSKLEKNELINEQSDLLVQKEGLEKKLANPIPEIKSRLSDFTAKYDDSRRTELLQLETTASTAPAISESCTVSITSNFSVRKVSCKTKGLCIKTTTTSTIPVFTNLGQCYKLPVAQLTTTAQKISSLIKLKPGEEIIGVYNGTAPYLLFVTSAGIVKKTAAEEYTTTNKSCKAIKVREGDKIHCVLSIDDENIVFITQNSLGLKFSSTDVNPTGKTAQGVIGIKLEEGDKIEKVFADNEFDLPLGKRAGKGKKIDY